MLLRENVLIESGIVIVMSDLAILAASTKTTLLEIAKQSAALGIGLQNAAPGDSSGSPNPSVQYLLETAEQLNKIAELCDSIISPSI